jgi:hypothetical protein
MEQETKLNAEDAKTDLVITREFDLPSELLLKLMQSRTLLNK